MSYTTVRITSQTLDRLKSVGRKTESYDRIINRMIDSKTSEGREIHAD